MTDWQAGLKIQYVVAAIVVLLIGRWILSRHKSSVPSSVVDIVDAALVATVLVFLVIRPFVFQAFYLFPTLGAAENITLPLDIAGRRVDRAWFDAVVDTVGLRDRLSHRPAELSGGEQQRVAGARALVARPEIVYADEPTGNLDSRSGAELLAFLRSAVDEHGQTIVMVTHDPVAASHADRIVFLADGRVVDEMREPTTERVLDRLKALEA